MCRLRAGPANVRRGRACTDRGADVRGVRDGAANADVRAVTLPIGYDGDPGTIVVLLCGAALLGFVLGALLVAITAPSRGR